MILAVALLLMGQVSSTVKTDAELAPAPEDAILAGAKACVGATVDPAGQEARLVGWPSTVPNAPAKDATGNLQRVAERQGVRLVVKTGIDGGCVVQAKGDSAFDKAKFLADLGAQAGVKIDGTQPRVDLPNGELLVTQVGTDHGTAFVQLVVANPNSTYVKHSQGN